MSFAAGIREFNRFYTRAIGTLTRDYLGTGLTVAEARVVFEIASAPGVTAKEIRARTGLDQGHLSRLIARLDAEGLVKRAASHHDAREQMLSLSAAGKKLFAKLDAAANDQIAELTRDLSAGQKKELLAAARKMQAILSGEAKDPEITIRHSRVGDLGYVFARQAVVYKEEFGYADVFETFVCQGLSPFMDHFDPTLDRLWIAEAGNDIMGFIAIHHATERPGWAKLRWFLVEKEARGRGLGQRLVDEALAFTRAAGYQGVFLTTVSDLVSARCLYERAGFKLVHEEPCPWQPREREQMWELELTSTRRAARRP